MSDIDSLPLRGVPFRALVDGSGIAIDGTATMDDLAIRGVHGICRVDASGVEVDGSAILDELRIRGVPFFCAVDENGVDLDSDATVDDLRFRGIPARCMVGADGVAQDGTLTIDELHSRGIGCFCQVDEDGNETSFGASIRLSGSSVTEAAAADTLVGTASLHDPKGIYAGGGTWSMTAQSESGWFSFDPDTQELTVTSNDTIDYETNPRPTVTLQYDDGVLDPISRTFSIAVVNVAPSITSDDAADFDTADTGTIYTITASDTGPGTPDYVFSISGADAADFVCDPDTGAVTLANPGTLADGGYAITVHASDGNLSGSLAVTLTGAAVSANDLLLLADGSSHLLLANGTDRLILASS